MVIAPLKIKVPVVMGDSRHTTHRECIYKVRSIKGLTQRGQELCGSLYGLSVWAQSNIGQEQTRLDHRH